MKTHKKRKHFSSGALLVEAAIGMGLLVFIAAVMLKATLPILAAQEWSIIQHLTDSTMTYEVAYAQRIPFEDIVASTSDFPLYPAFTSQSVVIGAKPGGNDILANVKRTRSLVRSQNNGSLIESWRLQSVLEYNIGNRSYFKTRQVIRVR